MIEKYILENCSLSIDLEFSNSKEDISKVLKPYYLRNRDNFVKDHGDNSEFILDFSKDYLYNIFNIKSDMDANLHWDTIPTVSEIKNFEIDINDMFNKLLLELKKDLSYNIDDKERYAVLRKIRTIQNIQRSGISIDSIEIN